LRVCQGFSWQEGRCAFGEGQAEGEGEGGEGSAVAGEESGAEGIVLDAGRASGGVGRLFSGQEGVADVGWVVDLESHRFSCLTTTVGQTSEVSFLEVLAEAGDDLAAQDGAAGVFDDGWVAGVEGA